MPAKDEPVVIKKYANRRLYNTGTSTYVTLDDLARMVKRDEHFVVQDAKNGGDITHSVLTQIIFELENDRNGQNMLPVSFLRQLIAFYGDQMQMVVPSFLEQSMVAFAREQERMREHMRQSFEKTPLNGLMPMDASMKMIEEQTRRNIEMFQDALRMFSPVPPSEPEVEKEEGNKTTADDLRELRDQMAAMQRKIDSLSKD